MTRTSRAEWIKRVQRWRESKLSAEAFAAQLGINAVRLRYWDWKLKHDPPRAGRSPAVARGQHLPPRKSQSAQADRDVTSCRSPVNGCVTSTPGIPCGRFARARMRIAPRS